MTAKAAPSGRFARGSFLRKIATLLLGTAATQAVVAATAPLLSRLYSPQDFGLYGTLMAMVSVLSVFATLRLERGVMVTRSPSERHGLIQLTLALSVAVGLVLTLAAWAVGAVAPALLPTDLDSPYLTVVGAWWALLGVAVVVSALQPLGDFLAVKNLGYRTVSATRVSGAVVQSSTQIGGGLAGAAVGLPLGVAIGMALRLVLLGWLALRHRWLCFAAYRWRWARLRAAWRRNTIYPRFMMWSALCNSANAQAMVLTLGATASAAAAGQAFLAHRMLAMPVALLAGSVQTANFQEASDTAPGSLRHLYLRRMRHLWVLGAGPFAAAFVLSPWLFPLVFGADWALAGALAQVLVPALYAQFAMSPFIAILTVVRRQGVYLAWSAGSLVLVAGMTYAGAHWGGDVWWTSAGFASAQVISYLAMHLVILAVLRPPQDDTTGT